MFAQSFLHMHIDAKPEASLVAEPSLFCARPPAACRKEGLRSQSQSSFPNATYLELPRG